MARLTANKGLKPGTPTKSVRLSVRAAAEWDRLLAELEKAGVQITDAHRAPLTLAATIAADIASDWDAIKEDGAYSANVKTGAIQAHPAVKRMDALRRDYLKVLTVLGLRSAAPDSGKGVRTLDDVLNG